jgi:hypothetical protein
MSSSASPPPTLMATLAGTSRCLGSTLTAPAGSFLTGRALACAGLALPAGLFAAAFTRALPFDVVALPLLPPRFGGGSGNGSACARHASCVAPHALSPSSNSGGAMGIVSSPPRTSSSKSTSGIDCAVGARLPPPLLHSRNRNKPVIANTRPNRAHLAPVVGNEPALTAALDAGRT